MTHDTATNTDNVDETEQFKHELSSNLDQLRPAIKDTVCCPNIISFHDHFSPIKRKLEIVKVTAEDNLTTPAVNIPLLCSRSSTG